MGLDLKSMFKKKGAGNSGVDVSQVKTGGQTSDSIISNAVAKAGNISGVTLSKEEQAQLMEKRKNTPITTVVIKYLSLSALAVTIVVGLLLKADLDPGNQYLGLLGLSDNTGSKFLKESKEKNQLEQANTELQNVINSLSRRSEEFEEASTQEKYGLLVPEIAEIESLQRRWFDETVTVTVTDEEGETSKRKEKRYGLIDSFNNMAEYFSDQNYQPRFFAENNRNQSEPEVCKYIDQKLDASQLAAKRKAQCATPTVLLMANEISVRGLNINASAANVSVSTSDLLSRVFTLSSEFVIMMNSFPFYKGAEVTNFTRRELSEGGDTMEISLRLDTQPEDEEDPADKYFIDFTEWEKYKKPKPRTRDN